MALIGSIRNKTWLVILVIGFALFAFIAGDLFGKGSAQNTILAQINGEEITNMEFQQQLDGIQNQFRNNGQSVDQMRSVEIAWNQMINQTMIEQQLEKLGVEIGEDELWYYLKNNPGIRQQFTNAEGQFDENSFTNYIKEQESLDPKSQEFKNWIKYQEGQKKQLATSTYNTLIATGLYVTDLEAKYAFKGKNDKADFKFVYIPYSKHIADVKVTDSELEKYIEEHKDQYKREESRDMAYVYLPYQPSSADKKVVQSQLAVFKNGGYLEVLKDTISSFASAKNDSTYVLTYSDEPSFINYVSESRLPVPYKNWITSASPGSVSDPINMGNGVYHMVKLQNKKSIADSLKYSHIMLSVKPDRTLEQTKVLADSLLSAIKSGSDYSLLAKDFSDDAQTAPNGGDLGWLAHGTFIPQIDNYVASNSVGSVGVVKTAYGYHLVKIEDKRNVVSKYKFVHLVKKEQASKETTDSIYQLAQKLYSKSTDYDAFVKTAGELNLSVQTAKEVGALANNLGRITNQRNLIKWAFNDDTELGDFQTLNDNEGSGIVFITGKRPKGTKELTEVREQVTLLAKQDKVAEDLKSKLAGQDVSNFEAVASKYGGEIKSAANISFDMIGVAGENDPLIASAGLGVKEGSISPVVKGTNGVYIIKKTKNVPVQLPKLFTDMKSKLQDKLSQKRYLIGTALEDKNDIVDNRSEFY